ncbi:U3 snoRNP protein [Emydomyces testavorans]|uniref:U3 snoRNP protein n=1 Tax=Emydomyces testavorans TaxID=2070801 RepID=A0AAF0IHK3_9EURO|nr:U3 snoRNP protein [Emydomyces testavorans]
MASEAPPQTKFLPHFTNDSHNEVGSSEEEVPPKDETEEQLERLLFGDSSGFRHALREHQTNSTEIVPRGDSEAEGEDDKAEDEDNESIDYFAGLDDADLFVLDTGTGEAPPAIEAPSISAPAKISAASHDILEAETAPAAWEDSDDERITVSLATHDRMRKLRLTEAEDLVTGKEYVNRLRRQFERLQPTPEWANPAVSRAAKRRKTRGDDSGRSEDESGASASEMDTDAEEDMLQQPLARLLQNVGNLSQRDDQIKSKGKRKLRQEVLDIQRLKDVGGNQPSTIDSLTFHPHYPLLLSSGPASTLFLHHVSPQSASPNPLITSLHARRTPLRTSAFLPPNGNRIFFSGRRRYFHVWDLDTGRIVKVNGTADRKEEQKSMEQFKLSPCGRWMGLVGTTRKGGGLINILDANTMQWVAQVRIDSRGGVADFAWWSDGDGMCVVGKNGEVSEWDGREKRIVARWIDEGAVGTTVISLGGKSGKPQLGGDRWVAIGSSSGIVNIYDRRPWAGAAAKSENSAGKSCNASGALDNMEFGIPKNPKPTRMLDQLTTPMSHLVFSSDGQLLAMASRWKRDALRLANEQGKIRLWEIHG